MNLTMHFIRRCIRYMRITFVVLTFLVVISMWTAFLSIQIDFGKKSNGIGLAGRSLFYIYNLSNDVVDLWPKEYNHHRLSLQPQFRENHGVGPVLDKKQGMYHTHQYSLFHLFHQRLLESKYRTMDPDKASVFFIPYDLGMDATTRHSDGALVQTNCPHVTSVMKFLQQSTHFAKSGGADHFMLHSINQMMVYYANDKCAELYKSCFNCTKLSIDTYPPGVFTHLDLQPHMTHNWISIPFPSNFHFSDTVTRPPWMQGARSGRHYSHYKLKQERPFALAFVGSAQVTAKAQRQLRLALMDACRSAPTVCLLNELGGHESHENILLPLVHELSKNKKKNTNTNVNPYSKARLCLTPGGDFPTRKGFFDAMLSGCVPVIFETTAALTQWPLHWTVPRDSGDAGSTLLRGQPAANGDDATSGMENLASQCIIYVPRDVAMRNMSQTFAYLVDLSEEKEYMAEKLRCIARVGFQMQYSLPAALNLKRGNKGRRDAVDVILDHLLLAKM